MPNLTVRITLQDLPVNQARLMHFIAVLNYYSITGVSLSEFDCFSEISTGNLTALVKYRPVIIDRIREERIKVLSTHLPRKHIMLQILWFGM